MSDTPFPRFRAQRASEWRDAGAIAAMLLAGSLLRPCLEGAPRTEPEPSRGARRSGLTIVLPEAANWQERESVVAER